MIRFSDWTSFRHAYRISKKNFSHVAVTHFHAILWKFLSKSEQKERKKFNDKQKEGNIGCLLLTRAIAFAKLTTKNVRKRTKQKEANSEKNVKYSETSAWNISSELLEIWFTAKPFKFAAQFVRLFFFFLICIAFVSFPLCRYVGTVKLLSRDYRLMCLNMRVPWTLKTQCFAFPTGNFAFYTAS